MLAGNAMANPQAWPANLPPHAKLSGNPKAKRVIFLCMAGGPSHLETFDYKPTLKEMDGKPMPDSITKGQPIAQLQGKQLKCFGPQLEFKNGANLDSILVPHSPRSVRSRTRCVSFVP